MGKLITGQAATYVEEIWINTKERYEIRCITRDVEKIVAESGISDGLVLVNPMHITACLLYTSPSPRDLSTSRMPSSA